MEDLSQKVKVEGGVTENKGIFYLTTALSIKASNLYYLLYGLFVPHTEIKKDSVVKGDLTDKEYSDLLTFMMEDSKQNAVISSFTEAGEKVDVKNKGLFITGLKSKAKEVLKIGDIITEVDASKRIKRCNKNKLKVTQIWCH